MEYVSFSWRLVNVATAVALLTHFGVGFWCRDDESTAHCYLCMCFTVRLGFVMWKES